jgi:hypothetical protein
MDLKHLLSIATATLTALGAILYSMGAQQTVLAMGLWLAAIFSLVVTDFLEVIRLPRRFGAALMWLVLVIFVLQFLLTWEGRLFAGHSSDWQLQTVGTVLICLQCILLFQEKDARTYGWLAVMSLLQVVVAARYSRGVAFGSLLIIYTIVGLFGLSLLALFAQRQRGHYDPREKKKSTERDEPRGAARWPLAGAEPEFASAPSGSERAGIVPELFARLSLVVAGGLMLAVVIFYTVPRPRIPSWHGGDSQRSVAIVGFNDQIKLGGLGETIESREEVMRVRLLDAASRQPYLLRTPEIYLRGTSVYWYSDNEWHRMTPRHIADDAAQQRDPDEPAEATSNGSPDEDDPALRAGPPVVQQTTLEPYLDRFEVFYIWPLIEPVSWRQGVHYEPFSERLFRRPGWGFEPLQHEFTFEVTTSGLADGRQVELVPARRKVRAKPQLLQLPENGASLPRLTALAEKWRREAGLKSDQHYEIARHFERQLSSSGQFHYSLQAVERQGNNAIEDFVSDNPRGDCEYFATALALMLRSQGIPSRVVLGYRCDEWDPRDRSFQVRQLHAHAWVEAFLDPARIPQSQRGDNPRRWTNGGWLRLDATPAEDLGSTAANHTTLGAWEARWHAMQHYWERYIADMDRTKQQESVYEPIRRAISEFTSSIFSWNTWRELFVGAWHGLAQMFRSGIMGKLLGVVLLIAVAGAATLAARLLARFAVWLWRRTFGRDGQSSSSARASVEFYHRFEQFAAHFGLFRRPGETPREFARTAGSRFAAASGRPELSDRAAQVAEAFYRVRFGRQELPAETMQHIQKALEELKGSIA